MQISKETKCTKSLLQEYNACESFGEASVDRIDLPEALDPSNIGERLRKFGVWCTVFVASGRRREIMDAYLALCRSKEDIRMLKEEAENVVAYYEEKRKIITKEMEYLSVNTDPFSRGAVAMLHLLLAKNAKLLEQSYQTLSVMKNETDVPQSKTPEDDSDDDCCSDDYYSDEDYM